MEKLVIGLGPAFAAGFAVQQLIELLDPFLDKIRVRKKSMTGLLSLALSLALAFGANLRVLGPLGAANVPPWADAAVTALVISAGTEGLNSVIKFLDHVKERAAKEAERI